MRAARGFTLLELLVSLSIFAAIGIMAYSGLGNVMRQQFRTGEHSERMRDLQLAYHILQRDFEQFIARDIRNAYGDPLPALQGGGSYAGVEFTHAGYPNPAGFLRSNLQRVAYVVEDGALVRHAWRVLDRSQDSVPDRQLLLDRTEGLVLRYLDARDSWQERWPPDNINTSGSAANAPPQWPRAVEVRLSLEDLGVLTWIFRLPDSYQPPPAQPGAGGEPDPGGEGDAGVPERGGRA